MRNRNVIGFNLGKKLTLTGAGIAALVVPVMIGALNAPAFQAQDTPEWQTKAGGKMAFEVASVKLDKGEFASPSFPMNKTDATRPLNGRFHADFPVWTYIQFAYKIILSEDQQKDALAHAPKWATLDRYAVEARVNGNPTKDQVRLMMQSLLAERFQLAVHFVSKEYPVLALTLVKPGKLGPKLRSHAEGVPCPEPGRPPTGVIRAEDPEPGTVPEVCDVPALIRPSASPRMISAFRNATMPMVAEALANFIGHGRPVVDKSGLTGRFDYVMQWTPETTALPTPNEASDPTSATPLEALRDQLGLKLESMRAVLQTLIIDKLERPSEN